MVNRSTANCQRSTADCGMITICFLDYHLLTTSCQRSTDHSPLSMAVRVRFVSTITFCWRLIVNGPRTTVHCQWRLEYALSLQLQFAVVCQLWTVDKLQLAVVCELSTVDKMTYFKTQINKSGICGYSSESLLHLTQDCTKWATLGYLKIRINNLEPLNGLRKPTASFG